LLSYRFFHSFTIRVLLAAAMAMLIVYVSIFVRLTHTIITKGILNRTQAWRYNVGDTN